MQNGKFEVYETKGSSHGKRIKLNNKFIKYKLCYKS